ncbi:MAG: hypothetical protein HY238_08725 [Acidobacteria bacterium]|nr:hypothetical protein [Acidobacteriota bacterium]
MKKVILLSLLLAAGAWATPVDGRWVVTFQTPKGTKELVLNLKADGDRLTGTVGMGRKGRAVQIVDGKINGDEISFTTKAGGRKQQNRAKILWTGRIDGNELTGSRQREGGRRGRPFTAVKQ